MTMFARYMLLILGTSLIVVSCARSPKKSPKNIRLGDDANSSNAGHDHGEHGDEGETPKPGEDPNTLMLTCSTTSGKKYLGLGGKELSAGRVEEVPKLGDRARIKPYSALSGEFSRVLNVVPNSLTANAPTFNAPAERWYQEPTLNGVNIFTAYRAAYEAALSYTNSDAMFAEAPTDESATQACTTIAEKAWNRTPTAQEIDACKKVALTDTTSVNDVKKRWAYAIAAVLAATGFMSY